MAQSFFSGIDTQNNWWTRRKAGKCM